MAAPHRNFTFPQLAAAIDQSTPDDISRAIEYASSCARTLRDTEPAVGRIYETLTTLLQFELSHGQPNPDHADELAAEVAEWLYGGEQPPGD